MRENSRYKFRAWDIQTESMRDVLVIDWVNKLIDLSGGIIERRPHEAILMQSTGLVDKHGIQIFEGDIVKNVRTGVSRKVYWDTHCASFHLSKQGKKESNVDYWSLSNPQWNYEVIGNVYQNKDLI